MSPERVGTALVTVNTPDPLLLPIRLISEV